MNDYIKTLKAEFKSKSNPEIAEGQKAYMKNNFEFYGIQAPVRREIQKVFLNKKYLPPKNELHQTVKILWNEPQREFQYFAQEFVFKYSKYFEKTDLDLFKYMLTHKSWWDTVDFISTKILGSFFLNFPEERKNYIEHCLKSQNIWLQRSAILFQLNYKNNLDTELLSYVIKSLSDTDEFFINKAIGWILRQYSHTNPQWVIEFVNNNKLSKLSRKEALRLLNL